MSEVDHSALNSSDDRSIGLRTRPDLVISESEFQSEPCWIVKDPLALKYFRLRLAEFLVLEELRQPTSFAKLKSLLVRRFPEFTTRMETIQQLVNSLHRSGLLISDAHGQSIPLQRRHDQEMRRKAVGLMSSIMSIRFPGWDPDRFLSWLHPKIAFLFGRIATTFFFVVVACAATLVLTNFSTFMRKLPDFSQFFAIDNLLFMGFILVFTKTLHELGHGLFCKHFGGECHQIGFMLLVMTPAMYCDTSDSWVLRNRWHRMAIGAAGMYVEVVMAAFCTFIWWFTNPGWLHYLALNIMFLSSVTTIIFNANPLLRYDGYYILSDFLEIPNLAQKSKMALTSWLRVTCLGMKPTPSAMLPSKNIGAFAVYSVTSFLYRWFIMFAICWLVSEVTEPFGLSAIGHIIIAISVVGLVVMPMVKMIKYFAHPGRFREVKKVRFYASATIIVAAIAAACLVPVPHYVWTSFVVRPQASENLVVHQPGVLTLVSVGSGDSVTAGQVMAKLSNPDLELQMEQFRGELAKRRTELAEYEMISDKMSSGASRIAETEMQIQGLEKQIELKQRQIEQLTIHSARDGRFFEPENHPVGPLADSQLATWSETPLSPQNVGVHLETNTRLGVIADPAAMEAIFVINQGDVQLLQSGQSVSLMLQSYPDTFLRTSLSYIARDEAKIIPRELSQTNGGPIPVKPAGESGERPMIKSYEAHASFNAKQLQASQIRLVPGMTGDAKIRVGNRTLAQRLIRAINSVVNFR